LINRSVIVTVPTFFGDGAARRCTLVDIEPEGLWISGEGVSEQVAKVGDVPLPHGAVPVVFVPFEQIGCVFDPAQAALSVSRAATGAKPDDAGDEAHPVDRRERGHSARSKHKGSMSAR
jgi:hypothetical protein